MQRQVVIAVCVLGGLWLWGKRQASTAQATGAQATATPTATADPDDWLGGWK